MVEGNYSIDNLPRNNYDHPIYSSGIRRTAINTSGEPASLRFVDTNDRPDMIRIRRMDRDPKANAQFADGAGEYSTDTELKHQYEFSGSGGLRFAVTQANKKESRETGEIQGWLLFLEDDHIESLRKEFINEFSGKNTVLELSYQRLSRKGANAGLMSSAVRQASLFLLKIHEAQKDLNISIVPPIKPTDLVITAYVNPKKDPQSRRLLKKSGFRLIGRMDYDQDDKDNEVWVVDWDKLHKMVQDKADNKLEYEKMK